LSPGGLDHIFVAMQNAVPPLYDAVKESGSSTWT
jgi:hypothetical protein